MKKENEQEGGDSSGRRYRSSFFLHLRPASFNSRAVAFTNTYFLGFLAVFLLVLEGLTGIFLMVYYSPSPEQAYCSITELISRVPFGSLIRDLHRLGGEVMIVVVVLHLLRVFFAAAYKGSRAITWISGILLLFCTLLLAFTGYLLPWDQLSYWAVTIGTSMAATIPIAGDWLLLLLRGGPEFAADGLLRFYLLHILALPLFLLAALAVHYYRVVRIHGITLPARSKQGGHNHSKKISLLPQMLLVEAGLTALFLAILILISTYFYDAPLGTHADPRHTPAYTAAPWFFLWLQGGLKLGNSFVMGILFPLLIFLLLLLLPFYHRSSRKSPRQRPLAIALSSFFLMAVVILSYMGRPGFAVYHSPHERLLAAMVPEEGLSVFHQMDYQLLPVGVHETKALAADLPKPFAKIVQEFKNELTKTDQQGIIIVEEWQENLKRIRLGIDPGGGALAKVVYVHRKRAAGAGQ